VGEQFDANLNQYYLRARYYNQASGRFTQQDTWMGINSDPVTLHKYFYANADPVTYTDPTGNFSIGSLMSAVNTLGTLVSRAQTAYSFFQVATGEQELSAKQIGFEILAGMGGGKLIKMFSKKFKTCKVGNSFVEGTLVSTPGGLVPIETVKIGDLVYSYDEVSGAVVTQEVVHLIQGDKEHEIITLDTSDTESIRVTAGHPFYVAANDDKWVPAKALKLGDELVNSAGGLIPVARFNTEVSAEKVYNLTVANTHTYYVGEQKLLAHNSTCRIPHRAKPRIEQGNDKEGWIHIQKRHLPGGGVSGKQGDLFSPGTSLSQIEQAARVIVSKGRRTSPVNRTVQTFEQKMVINGKQARYKVVVDSDDGNRIITMFPVGK
jgi:RHS repeat-associated protein